MLGAGVRWGDDDLKYLIGLSAPSRRRPARPGDDRFACQSCGAPVAKWLGRCPDCEQWNSYVEEVSARSLCLQRPGVPAALGGRRRPARATHGFKQACPASTACWAEASCRGPRASPRRRARHGKSTLPCRSAAVLPQCGRRWLYATGEESAGQVRLRADRPRSGGAALRLAETDVAAIVAEAGRRAPRS
jgi:DNA repair protein RadA/Sms